MPPDVRKEVMMWTKSLLSGSGQIQIASDKLRGTFKLNGQVHIVAVLLLQLNGLTVNLPKFDFDSDERPIPSVGSTGSLMVNGISAWVEQAYLVGGPEAIV